MALHLNKFESPSPKDSLCKVWLNLAWLFCRRRFLNFVNIFTLFHYYLALEKGMALHLNKIEFPSHKNTLCQVWQKLVQSSGSGEEDFLKFVNVFQLFCYYLPLEKDVTLYLNKLEFFLQQRQSTRDCWGEFSRQMRYLFGSQPPTQTPVIFIISINEFFLLKIQLKNVSRCRKFNIGKAV